MTTILNRAVPYGPAVARIGLAVVYLWFGAEQWLHTAAWTSYVPDAIPAMLNVSADLLVRFNGTFELIFGTCLLLGLFTRISAGLLGLHMLHIMITVGYGSIAVRDFGLAMATISLFFSGPDRLTIDARFRQSNNASPLIS